MSGPYYSSGSILADTDMQSIDLSDDVNKGFKSIAITNDHASYALTIYLNDLANDVITINAGETFSINTNVWRVYYQGASGTTPFRVVAD